LAVEGHKDFSAEVLLSADVDGYLMQQSVMIFTDASGRTAALVDVLREGMVTYLKTDNSLWLYDGSSHVGLHVPWTSYTPALSWAGGGGTQGAGTLGGKYRQVGGDYQVVVSFTWAADTTDGTGAIQLGLPSGVTQSGSQAAYGAGWFIDSSTGAVTGVSAKTSAGGTIVQFAAAGVVTATYPVTTDTGDSVEAELWIRP
jgi:hypothetical protein